MYEPTNPSPPPSSGRGRRGGGRTKGLGGRTQPNSRSDESPWVLGARGIPLCLSPSSFSLPLCLSNYPLPLFPFKSLSSSVSPLSRRHRSLFSPVSSFTRGISPPPSASPRYLSSPPPPPLPPRHHRCHYPSITNTTQWDSSPSTPTKLPTSTVSGGDR